MRAKIIKILKVTDIGAIAEFQTPYGNAIGIWEAKSKGSDYLKEGREYLVEFDIDKELLWGTDITEEQSKDYKIWMENNKVVMIVSLEKYEVDNDDTNETEGFPIATLRFGETIILTGTKGQNSTEGTFLKIQLDEIVIYPYDWI